MVQIVDWVVGRGTNIFKFLGLFFKFLFMKMLQIEVSIF
jgi:hypothetical protein